MNLSKIIISAASTVAVVSAIGFAYAQAPAGRNDRSLGKDETPFADHSRNLNQRTTPTQAPMTIQPGNTSSSAPAPAAAMSSSSGTGALGAAPSSEPMAQADRN